MSHEPRPAFAFVFTARAQQATRDAISFCPTSIVRARVVAAALGAAAALSVALAPAGRAADITPITGRTAIVQRDVRVRSGASAHAAALTTLSSATPITLRQMTVPVLASSSAPDGSTWLRVRLPARPNGGTGWIPASAVATRADPWHIEVSLGLKRLTLYRGSAVARRFRVVVGAHSTPTPAGHFFIIERLRLHTSWAPNKWALATSAYSDVLQHFDGGVGEVALHATGYLSDPMGTAASHGCVRLTNSAAAWLAARVPPGTPIDINR